MTVHLISVGYLHDNPPTADLTVDVRRYLRDPAAAADILDLDGRHPRVQHVVGTTDGTPATLTTLTHYAQTFPHPDCTIAIGCAGGRHCSAALVEILAATLRDEVGLQVHITHRHIHLPRVLRRPGCTQGAMP